MAWTRFTRKKDMPGGLWIRCESCGQMLFRKEFESKHRVCGDCGHHYTLPGRARVDLTVDEGSFEELHKNIAAVDRLSFNDRVPYKDKLTATRKKTGEKDAIIIGTATIKGHPVVLAVMNFEFLGGSMGMVVGEKLALAIEKACETRTPVVIFSCSGGARMHEGAISLMQMAKTCGALSRLDDAGVLSISVMTHPTTGGVTASFASVCDVLLAEPNALIGFAGPRVIATTIKKELPQGFQRSEFLLERGQVDRIVDRDKVRDELARLLAYANGTDPVKAYRDPWPAPAEASEGSKEAAPPAKAAKEKPVKKARKPRKLRSKRENS